MPRHFWPPEQFEFALTQICLSEPNKRVLQAFLDAPAHTLTARTLAEQAALPGGWTAANLRIGELSRKFFPYLGPLTAAEDGDPHWWRYISTGVWKSGQFHWTLRRELQLALLALGWRATQNTLLPEELSPEDERLLTEGAAHRISVNTYERNAEARRQCLEEKGFACSACDTLLADVYGEAAEGLIHVHHQVPLSSIGRTYVVNASTDLVPVCPNCHAVMHRQNPPYTVEEVREMLKQKGAGAHHQGGA